MGGGARLEEVKGEAHVPEHGWVVRAQRDVHALVHQDRERVHGHGRRQTLPRAVSCQSQCSRAESEGTYEDLVPAAG